MTQDPPDWEQLRARALELARRAGGSHGVTPSSLDAAIKSAPAPSLDDALLNDIYPRLDEVDPLPRLVLCLQLLRSVEDSPYAADWAYRLARVADTALYALGRLEFFPLRLTLLDKLLATELPTMDRADLLFRRGNTRVALVHGKPNLLDSAIQDLIEAAELARACGFMLVELKAEFLLARAEFLELPGRQPPLLDAIGQRIARLEALLPRVEPRVLVSDLHDILGELEGRGIVLGRVGAAARAIHHARRAAELTDEPEVKAIRLASLSQLMLLHGTPEERASAVQLARQAVQSLPPGAGDVSAVLPHATLGEALQRHGQATEAIGHLEHALRLMAPQSPSSNRNLIRLRLARALFDVDRPDDARHQLELTFEEAHTLGDAPGLRDATQLLVEVDHERGRDDVVRDRLLEAETRLAGTPAQTRFALMRLSPELHASALSAEFLELVRRYLSGKIPTDDAADAQLQASIANHTHQLPQDIRRQLLTQGGRIIRDVAVRARLLEADGRRAEALDALRAALAHAKDSDAGLGAASLLIALLPEDAHEERLRGCDEVEKLLEGPRDSPHTRTDLASALWMAGRRDRGLLERAWRHAERALRQLALLR